MVQAVLVAGSPNTGPLSGADPSPWEALIPVNGRPMVDVVARVLLTVPAIEDLAVVGPPAVTEIFAEEKRVRAVPAGDGLMENVARGLTAFPDADQVLVVTADIPLLTAAAVTDFLERCGNRREDIYYPIVEENTVNSRYPQVKRTYVRLREGRFTGGNLVLFRPAVFPRCRAKGEEFTAYRKQPLKLAGVLGVTFLLRFVTGRLGLSDAENKVTTLLGISGRAVITPFPEIAVDVDKPSDLVLARASIE